jgi:hypothetical protein
MFLAQFNFVAGKCAMKGKRLAVEQIVAILKQAELGMLA